MWYDYYLKVRAPPSPGCLPLSCPSGRPSRALQDRSALPLNLNPQLTWCQDPVASKNEQARADRHRWCHESRCLRAHRTRPLSPAAGDQGS